MTKQVQFRRGTTAQHTTFTGALAEVTVDTDKKTLIVHDGTTAGGSVIAKDASAIAYSIALGM
jgi:orotate phosphoribosyltransferase